MTKRLQVVIAHAGFASRRKARLLIESGRVTVNGKIVKSSGFRVNTDRDIVKIGGKPVGPERKVYFVLNKPGNTISTVKDTHDRKTVLGLMDMPGKRIYPVGRLDKDTKGILLLTNDGELSYALTHPRFRIKKAYRAKVKGFMDDRKINKLEKGITLDGKNTAPCRIRLLKRNNIFTELNIEIHEGRKRQVRRMCEIAGHRVADLERVSFAGLKLGSLKRGKFRSLTNDEICFLKKKVGLA